MSQRIVLIQDDPADARSIIEALDRAGDELFQVDWVRSCAEGIERLAGAAAILVDLTLPDSRGIETFDRLFLAAPDIPILVLTSPPDEAIAKLAVQRGAQDYLFKARLDAWLLPKTIGSMIERAAITEALYEEQQRARVTLDSIGDAVVSTDVAGQVTYLNVIAERLTGWSSAEALGRPLEEVFRIIDATTREIAQNPMRRAIRENKTVAAAPNCVLIRRDGVEAAIEDRAAPVHDRRGAVSGAVMVIHHVSLARALVLKISNLAQEDSLPEPRNRVALNERLDEAIALSSRHGRKLAVLSLDLDRFRHINASLGRAVGDSLMQSVSQRLFTCVRSSDTISRQGADEFVVLLWEVKHAQDAAITADKILQALREPHHIRKHELHITASIGIVTYPEDGTDAETLLKKADFAMHAAKESGRDRYQFFELAMNTQVLERQWVEDSLRHAIERQELLLHYQPKINLASGLIIGVEALVRWHHPQRGLVPPGEFIAIAEQCGLIVPIGRWVLREACRQARAWQVAGLPLMSIAINISSVELRADGFVAGVRSALEEMGLEARCLEFELTETALLEGSKAVADVLKELKDIGVRLALDDFGTGHASLNHLQHSPIDALKIDQSFVRDITTDADDAGIVTAVIGLGRSLRMCVVAEGVETRQQLTMLQQQGCAQGQGYYFSPPVPAVEFGRLLTQGVAARPLG
jgi:diguanylate cyclase (GGDEF)-like protein/PAS domain S-box-containing protein